MSVPHFSLCLEALSKSLWPNFVCQKASSPSSGKATRHQLNSSRIMGRAHLARKDIDASGIKSEAVRKAWAAGFVPYGKRAAGMSGADFAK